MPRQRVAAGSQGRTASMVAFLPHAPLGHNPVRTSMFPGPGSLLKGLLFCLSISLSLGQDILLVKYPKATLQKQEGETLNLNCTVDYDQNRCEDIHAHWCKLTLNAGCPELTDTSVYLIQVSEKILGNGVNRSRLVALSFNRLTFGDRGTFQCNAECGGNGLSARGNLIKLSVKKADPKRNPLNNCGILRAEVIAIALHFLFLFACSTLYLC
ncbi:hypothetical protein ANANG_G00067810 [Anguilla anguilla]|uniref:Ig-like domain-containing protein n=1 Tax=Anguilla anguilla TaxID=7936 RepID=A0A9D3MS44_ANGAN|nr:hypothetical protein ANANG_G00067810 [Anguilla anguilla]